MVRYDLGLLVLAVEDEGWRLGGEGSREAGGRGVLNPSVSRFPRPRFCQLDCAGYGDKEKGGCGGWCLSC